MTRRSSMTGLLRERAAAQALLSPSPKALRWLIGLRLVVVSTLFLGILLIQFNSERILPLRNFYGLILLSFGLSLVYLVLYARRFPPQLQTWVQLIGDIVVVTGFVYVTGGLYSPFSFLYLTVIAVAAMLMRGGGLIFAGLSAVAYGLLVDLMVFAVLPMPQTLSGLQVAVSTSRVLIQLLTNVVGFVLVAVLVSYLGESLRSATTRLREETERTRQFVALTDHVVRSVGAGIIATDLELKVLHLNPAGARMLAIGDGEAATGSGLDEIMPLTDQNWGLLTARALDRKVMRLEGTAAASGVRFGLTVGPLTDEVERVVGFIVTFQDLSEIKVEAERQRLQERMAAVGELAARMAHEIKNPLASISGSAQVLAAGGSFDDKGRRLLHILVDESRRLSGILDGFLAYTRPKRSDFTPCDVSVMLRDCIALLGRSDEHRDGHRIRLEMPDSLVLEGEEQLLRQIFWNLSRNALQAMPDGGELTIAGERRGGSVVLRWRDSGTGMTEDVRRQAFEPFVTTRPGGTGLGLAVVYAAVAEHGGTVAIDSAPGRGTIVTVELPVHREAA
ncbi:MAG: ATP-binding protein [Thermoanaerobaculales bacterium]|nr:ATP-binding protein [Thermoanaerobaculales bacterium]